MSERDRQLLLDVHRGDDDAARLLWVAYAGMLRSYAASISPAAADDVVQRAFCRILERPRAELSAVRDVPGWLVTVARREAIGWLRGERRELALRRGRLPCSPVTRGLDPELEDALHELPRQLREVVVLRHVVGLSLERAAVAIGVNRNTLAWRYARAIERLRLQLRTGDVEGEREVSDAAR